MWNPFKSEVVTNLAHIKSGLWPSYMPGDYIRGFKSLYRPAFNEAYAKFEKVHAKRYGTKKTKVKGKDILDQPHTYNMLNMEYYTEWHDEYETFCNTWKTDKKYNTGPKAKKYLAVDKLPDHVRSKVYKALGKQVRILEKNNEVRA